MDDGIRSKPRPTCFDIHSANSKGLLISWSKSICRSLGKSTIQRSTSPLTRMRLLRLTMLSKDSSMATVLRPEKNRMRSPSISILRWLLFVAIQTTPMTSADVAKAKNRLRPVKPSTRIAATVPTKPKTPTTKATKYWAFVQRSQKAKTWSSFCTASI